MASKLFLDANVLLDLTLKREGCESVKQIVLATLSGHVILYTSASIIHILGYWLTKYYGSSKAKELLISLLDDVYVLETTHDVVSEAVHSKQTDIEDAIQYQTALYHKLTLFVSRDKLLKKTSSSSLPVVEPSEALKMI